MRVFCRFVSVRGSWYFQIEYVPEDLLQTSLLSLRSRLERSNTPGLEVVWLPKVEPVGGMVGGNFDL